MDQEYHFDVNALLLVLDGSLQATRDRVYKILRGRNNRLQYLLSQELLWNFTSQFRDQFRVEQLLCAGRPSYIRAILCGSLTFIAIVA